MAGDRYGMKKLTGVSLALVVVDRARDGSRCR
jgi:hypothetical protein